MINIATKSRKKIIPDTKNKIKSVRITMITTLLILVMLGLFFVLEVSSVESYTKTNDASLLVSKQLVGVLLGLGAGAVASLIPQKWWLKLAPIFYILTIILLVLVLVLGGDEIKGANRQINLPFMTFQPVDMVKFFLIVFFARLLGREADGPPAPPWWLVLGLLAIPLVLIFFQPNFSAILMISAIIIVMWFLSNVPLKTLAVVGVVGVIMLTIFLMTAGYRQERVATFLGGNDCVNDGLTGENWQICQIKMALGRGGWFGVGIGNSKQKFSYIPEASTDSIFAIVGEEIGFIGVGAIIALYGVFFYSSFKIIYYGQLTQQEKLLGYGIWTWLVIQTLMNLGVITELIPLTGVPLPFFSFGSTSLVMSLVASGVILGLSKNNHH